MNNLRRTRWLSALLCLALLQLVAPWPGLAQEASPNPADPGAAVTQAREHLKNGAYDAAIKVLRESIDASKDTPQRLPEVYLFLINTYVIRANSFKLKTQEVETAGLYNGKAEDVTRECLGIKELRHTRPDPANTDYAPETIALFDKVRSEMFGSFQVLELVPSDAIVILDADSLRAAPGDNQIQIRDVPVGAHHVIVRRDGYARVAEDVAIPPNSNVVKNYVLKHKHGRVFLSAAGALAAGAVTGVVLLVKGRSTSSTVEPLPEPPPPPAR